MHNFQEFIVPIACVVGVFTFACGCALFSSVLSAHSRTLQARDARIYTDGYYSRTNAGRR